MTKLRGLYLVPRGTWDVVYGPDARRLIDDVATMDLLEPSDLEKHLDSLAEVEIVLSSWGCPTLDQRLLDAAPQLRAVFYGAGSLRRVVTDEFWRRNIPIVSARDVLAEGVTQFVLAQIHLSLKHVFRYQRSMRDTGGWVGRAGPEEVGSTVGLVSLGAIGRRVARGLADPNLTVLAYEPFADPDVVSSLPVTLTSIEEVFSRSDVVSLHTPMLDETRGLIGADLLGSMKQGATLINTARGGLIDEAALASVLGQREDLTALLDVTDPEPPKPDSPLFTLPNLLITPHIAGNVGWQRYALGRGIAEEVVRFSRGEPLRWAVRQEDAPRLA